MREYTELGENSILCRQWLELLDELNIGAFTADKARQITAINFSAQALMGLGAEEVIGHECREVFCGVPCLVNCHFTGEDGLAQEEPDVEVYDEAGSRHLITRMATPIFDAAHQVTGCLTVLQDHSPIADLINRVQYEGRSLKIILDNIDIGLFTVNRGGLITFFNTEAEKVTGYDRRQVLGQPCNLLFDEADSEDRNRLMDSIDDGKPRSNDSGKLTDSEGVGIPIRANYMALRNEKGMIIGGLATFQDLTLVHQLNQAISDRYTYHDMIGRDPAMQQIFETLKVLADSDANILIEGSTGTGKDLLAKVIHSTGRRSERSMVKVNCAAIPDNLLESELFGYTKGAFTGAERNKPGRFQEADGSTIFLDEIGDLTSSVQAKLLRVLEDKEFYPLGGSQTVRVDVRIISATNRNLEEMVAAGSFREDLFYRLNVLRIELPPLSQRRADIPLLIRHIMRRLCVAKGCRPRPLSEAAMDILLNYDYPGNVRELENILEHALTICQKEEIGSRELPVYLQKRVANAEQPKPVLPDAVPADATFERERILRALRANRWHRVHTAAALGVDRTTLWRRMKRLGISAGDRR